MFLVNNTPLISPTVALRWECIRLEDIPGPVVRIKATAWGFVYSPDRRRAFHDDAVFDADGAEALPWVVLTRTDRLGRGAAWEAEDIHSIWFSRSRHVMLYDVEVLG